MSEHNHSHEHSPSQSFKTAFIVGIALNTIYVIVETIAGLKLNSLALLADAGHNLSDVAGLLLAWLAAALMKQKSSGRFTYGYKRISILVTFINNLLLLIAIGAIAWEAFQRFKNPHPTEGISIALVAVIGIVINAVTAYFFYKGRKGDLNIKSAYLHMATDALVSAGVVVAGIIIYYTGLQWIDPAISLLIVVVILISSWHFFRETAFIVIDAAPLNVNVGNVRNYILSVNGVLSIHDLHIWKISTSQTALTAHIIISDETNRKDILQNITHELEHHYNISHSTIQTETSSEECEIKDC